jgi:hypothetical protein
LVKYSTPQTSDVKSANYMNKILANTFRYMYHTCRLIGCELVAIEFKYKGTIWRADTAEEAVALRNELEKSDKVFIPPHGEMDEAARFWTPDRFMDVITGIGDLQRQLLVTIREHPNITGRELVRQLDLDSEVSLAGVISGLSKKLKKLGIEPKQVLVIAVDWSGKTKTRRFLLDDFFVEAGMEQNWPAAWGKKGKHEIASSDSRTTTDDKSKRGQR